MELNGTIVFIGSTQQVSDKFKKRDFAVKTSEEYPQTILVTASQKKCEILDNFKVGESVNVSFNLRGKEYVKNGETKYFNSIELWKMNRDNSFQEPKNEPANGSSHSDEGDGLPF